MGAVADQPVRDRAMPARVAAEHLAFALFGLFIFFTCFTFLRPSPYDFAAIPAMAIWIVLGLRFPRTLLPLAAVLLGYNVCLVAGLIPFLDEADPSAWTFQSVYLSGTAVFFAMFFSEDTDRRVEFALKGYVASCLFAAAAGILSYAVDTGILFVMDGRAAGVFEDPNVLGSFLILGVLYLLRNVLTGEARHPVVSWAGIGLILSAIFLSFSRGSWGAAIVAIGLMVALTYRTSPALVRRRIAILAVGAVLFGTILIAGLLSVGTVADRFSDRAQLTQDYDEGVTGRFGNQLRSIPMILDRPGGLGPLRFRLTFGLEPHNSYIGGFANGGWLGGLLFVALVGLTGFIGFRLCIVPSPFRRPAQIVWPALFVFFVQALQIDIDHWRHVYIMLGLVWGLEAARVARSRRTRREPRDAPRLLSVQVT